MLRQGYPGLFAACPDIHFGLQFTGVIQQARLELSFPLLNWWSLSAEGSWESTESNVAHYTGTLTALALKTALSF